MDSIRVLIADDDACIRKCLCSLLGVEQELRVVGEAGDGVEATVLARELRPDVVILDVEMPHLSGIDATRAIKQWAPDTRVVVLSVYDSMQAEAIGAGADCFLLKDCGRAQLAAAIRRICTAGGSSSTPVGMRGAASDATSTRSSCCRGPYPPL